MAYCDAPTLRIVSLPRELQTVSDVYNFMIHRFNIGTGSKVTITNMESNGVPYRTAFINWQPEQSSGWTGLGQVATIVSHEYFRGGIHFDNGSPMDHLKIVHYSQPPLANLGPPVDLQLGEGEWNSIYIGVVPGDLNCAGGVFSTDSGLRCLFEEKLGLGQLDRFDFTSKTVESTNQKVLSAYVHFDKWYDTLTTRHIRQSISTTGSFKCTGYYEGGEFFRFDNGRYLVFKINRAPIPTVEVTPDLNIHQFADYVVQLEVKTVELSRQLLEKAEQANYHEKLYQACTIHTTSLMMDVQARDAKISELEEALAYEKKLSHARSIQNINLIMDVKARDEKLNNLRDDFSRFKLQQSFAETQTQT
jgi:hypothetical protein